MLNFILVIAMTAMTAGAATITADSSDFEAFTNGIGGSNLGDFGVGDTGGGLPDQGRRAVLRFSLAGLEGVTLQTAVMKLFIIESRKDQYPAPGIIDNTPPITNPGLGDTLVIHIADYVTPKASTYNAPSIGNDPGVLIGAAVQPGSNTVSIDVKNAMQQAIDSGFSYVTFRIQTATEKDGDGLNDLWFFASADYQSAASRPTIDFAANSSSFTAPGSTAPEPSTAAMLAVGAGLLAIGNRAIRRP